MQCVRVIPVLLLREWGIVKTVNFDAETYIGCPVNAVRVFNASHVDELILLDIRATESGRGPLPEVVRQISDEAWMPMTVGGGIRSIEQIRQMLQSGADKVAINSQSVDDPEFIRKAAEKFGSQSIVVSIDARRDARGGYEVMTHRGRQTTGLDPVAHAVHMQELGAGEILLNSIELDGAGCGYDLDLLRQVSAVVHVPVVACGGAGKLQDFADAVTLGGAAAVSAGSLFLYHGRRRGILINFPSRDELQATFGRERVRV